ncbi:hypothetical protein BJ973_002604 [Actinoplanes tereljensis]|uniref:Uncharacterized protein n=1 Tax=Paractinoplanes tereljensis TaxID=571912 RepID=A0A919TVE7_9ACTN|nr:hypothetical protein [Actinoplanes tereljensis]GIF22280.1 hypothetical protein Ate02nite_50100 [Actinoplanes tereljensis]
MGGEWHGLLFDNQTVGVQPALTWNFRIPIDGGPAALTVEWLPLPAAGWQDMAGAAATCDSFAEPVEACVHDGGHHRYDRIDLRITEQDGPRIRVLVTVAGDIDHHGPAELTADAWLTFTGILVQLGGTGTAGDALTRLAGFTKVDGLAEVPDPRGIAFRFAPH